MVDIGEHRRRRRIKLERELGQRVEREDVASTHDAELVELGARREPGEHRERSGFVGRGFNTLRGCACASSDASVAVRAPRAGGFVDTTMPKRGGCDSAATFAQSADAGRLLSCSAAQAP